MGTRRSKEDDWTEVTRKNRSYRTKEDDLVKVHSNADHTRTISKSIFVKNFPDNTTSVDLWNISQTYGVVVDVYIPNRRSKVGKHFAFVRFIKVTNVERLVGNLCTLWIGRMHLHANVVRFERTPFQQSQPPPPTRPGKIAPSFVSAVKGILPTPVLSPPAMVLDDSCMVTTDLRNYVMGEVKLFSSVNNLRVILSAEGFSIQKVVYLGGLWVMFELPSANSKSKFLAHVGVGSWFKSLSNPQPDFSPRDRIIWVDVEGVPMHAWSSNTFHKIGSMWGEVLELGDCKDECFARKRLCIKTNRDDNILEKFKIIVKGKSFVVRAKELFVWSPSFVEVTEADDIHEEGEFIQIGEEGLEKPIHQTNVEEESDLEAVSETFFGDQADDLNEVVDSAQQSIPKENSYDPFNIYDILNKENKDVNAAATNSSIPFSPGFTPDKPDTDVDELDDQFSTGSIENIQKKKESGSILEILEEMISVGQTMGFSMEGSIKDMERIIDLKGADDHETKAEKVSDMEIKSLWGNTNFDAIVSQSLAVCLDRHLSDHRPILLREFNTDYGATPFRLFHSWFDFQGFDDMITQTWNSINLNDSNAMIQLGANDDLLSVRSELLKQYHDIHSVETRESIQKAKIKWAVEGDENSKFFHGMINRKRANLAVKGVMIDGEWVDDPSKVKDEFRDYFASRFCDPGIRHGVINFNFPNRLNIDQSGELEAPISRDEIRRAVWDCGENKSPGPDGFTFEFFRKFWNIVGPDLCLAVEWFFHHASFPVGCRISLIGSKNKIVDEILANRLSHCLTPDIISTFKTTIDFAKAYDSIRWDYLGDVLKSFGFGVKWCSWIRGILNSSMASILVNGSPTKEFQFHRGLKQGDPLAPYLFIIIMESLHLSFSRVIEAGIFTGIKIDSSMTLSHLFYADDAVFIGECLVCRDGEKKIAWVSWSKVLASKSNGGLGVSSFYALNRGLLFKWIWRFLSRDQSLWAQVVHALHGSNTSTFSASYSSLWSSIIKECNALKSQDLDLISHCKIRVGNGMSTSFWHDQWLGDSCLRLSYPRLFALENNKVCSVAAKMSAPFVSSLRRDVRGGEESAQLSRISDLLDTVVLSNMGDRRFWDLNGDGCFRVKDVRRLLDDMLLPKSDVPSRWVKQIPIKVNVLAWKISMDRLPTRVNLHRRGVQVSPISCPICCEALENLDHLLFCCDLAKDIARFNQVQNKCWKECFTLPGGVSGHIETISSSLIQIFEKMVFLKT
ncbi:RNA-directed DNA polymerase, eukaryota [Tanacetum coccineum]